MAALRNNGIIESDFLNRSCAFEACLELILLGDPPENLFSTASTKSMHYRIATAMAGSPRSADIPCGGWSCVCVPNAISYNARPCCCVRVPSRRGFVAPCLPSPAPQPPSGERWLHEIKHDGSVSLRARTASGCNSRAGRAMSLLAGSDCFR